MTRQIEISHSAEEGRNSAWHVGGMLWVVPLLKEKLSESAIISATRPLAGVTMHDSRNNLYKERHRQSGQTAHLGHSVETKPSKKTE